MTDNDNSMTVQFQKHPWTKATKTRAQKMLDLHAFVIRSETPKTDENGVEMHRDLLMRWLYGRPSSTAS